MVNTSKSPRDAEGEEDIWGAVLQGYKKGGSSSERGTLIVLGDANSGKTALLARARGENFSDLKRGVALSYDFMSVYADSAEEPIGDIDVWILEGETLHGDLLRSNLAEDAITNSMAVICLDFMQPWLIEETLNKWLEFLRKMLADVRADIVDKKCEEQIVHYLQNYNEPAEDSTSKQRKKKRAPIVISDETRESTDGFLKFNLGIPIVVVCCKSDATMLLEKDYDIKTPIFDYIQLYLRQTCVHYGASLVFASAKKDINTELFMDYIEHRLFRMEFTYRASIIETDSIFVPSGWDSIEKIQIDAKTLYVDLSEPFTSVVKKPQNIKRNISSPPIYAEDDAAFLAKHKAFVDSENAENESLRGGSWRTPTTSTPTSLPLLTKQPSSSSITTTTTTTTTTSSPFPSSSSTTSQLQPRAPSDTTFISPSAKDKHVLATFFDALMKSKDAKTAPLGRGVPQARHDVEKELERITSAMKK